MTLIDRPMRLSKRVQMLRPPATLAVTARARELREQGVDVVSFGAGEPDFDTPEAIRRSAVEALRAGQTHYMPVPGTPAAREAIARKLRRDNGIACSPRDIVISCGAKHSIYLAFQCLLDPGAGQEVILPTPAWVSYRPIVELAGGTVVEVPGPIDNDFKIVPAQLEAAITPRTAAIVVNTPSNPCGTMYTPQELRDLAEVLQRHEQITIVTDEIYEKLIFGGIAHLSLGSLPGLADRVVTVNGLGKAFAMTGWRIGYACCPGGDGALASAMEALQGQMTSNITSFCYAAIVEALERGAADVERMRRAFAERAAAMHGRVTAMPGVRCPRPTGAFYVFPDLSAHFGKRSPAGRTVDSSVTFAEALLEEAHVAVVPGSEFGECGEGHVRLSFAAAPAAIEEGCRRLGDFLHRLR
jgi:aspartate aminotransferase